MQRPGRSNDYGRSDALQRLAGQTGILVGRSANFSPAGQAKAAADFAAHPERPHARWNLEPALFTPNEPTGILNAPWTPLDHISMVDARPLNGTPGNYSVLGQRDPRGAAASWPVTNPMATAQPPIGTEVRMPMLIAERLDGSGKLSPTPAPGVFNDAIALNAINAALSGAPNSAIRKRVQAAADQYDAMAQQQLMLYMADDAVARQLIARAADIPLSSINRGVLEAAQRHLSTMPQAMPSPFGL
jgi:hypothetical protein